jgi:UDP-N-acetylglucosamine transferase subunit ALG13
LIFVTTGSMLPFDRLTRAVDEWAARCRRDDVLVQIGTGKYQPRHARWVRMMKPREFTRAVQECELVVAHLGMGSIITAMQARKPVLLLPRLHALGELTSDHQLHGAEWLRDRAGVWIADDTEHLQRLLDDFAAGRVKRPEAGASEFASPELLEKVRSYIWHGTGMER